MAHLGRNYPLHFRRDLIPDLRSNQNSWPKGFKITDGLIATFATTVRVVVPQGTILHAIDEETLSWPRWGADGVAGEFGEFDVRLVQINDDGFSDPAEVELTLWRDGAVKLAMWPLWNAFRNGGRILPNVPGQTHVTWDALFNPFSAFNLVNGMEAAGWGEV